MPGMILVKHVEEEKLLISLICEFANKVILPRNFKANEVFNRYKEKKIYGITGVEVDGDEAIFQVELPPQYIKFIDWAIMKKRKELNR